MGRGEQCLTLPSLPPIILLPLLIYLSGIFMTAAHPPSAALAAGSELISSNHAVKIDAALLARSLGQHVLPGEAQQGSARLPASFSSPSLHCQPTGDE